MSMLATCISLMTTRAAVTLAVLTCTSMVAVTVCPWLPSALTVMVACPSVLAVATPLLSTLTTPGLLDVHCSC